ncbi:Lamin Tail Domain [Ohtaekwangia koreensis]|uniref:Lamin Tail Domain n=2 Tax=Ohtaekwangia koreensis TaxID=688867 RepID=A0A1T5LFI3_9BACT|nr:Lamin Tail Domain [Ohtaekwangia koreensis]
MYSVVPIRNMLQIFTFSILKTFTKKSFITFSFLFFSQQMFAQLTDSFQDSDFLNDPSWSGQNTKFTVLANQLKLQAPAVSDDAYLSTPSKSINDASWEFYIRLGFNSSSTNYARVYLVSSQQNLADTLNGYFVMVGNTADEISLYKQTGSSKSKIIDGVDGKLNLATAEVKVRVTRDASGNWQLYSDVGTTGNYISEGSVTDAEHFSSSYFGVYCSYTATRSDKFYFDDFVVTGNPYVPPVPPSFKDIVFTEIFADPSPRVELPETEYLELFNRSNNAYNLSGWKLSDGSSTATLPSYKLNPGEYVLLVASSSVASYITFENVVGLSSFPSLNNTGDIIVLKHTNGITIDSVKYSDDWYRDDEKKQGGWSLELIDPNNPCGEENNWTASEAENGGTPGEQNSVFANKPDLTAPKLMAAIPIGDNQLRLVFDEKLLNEIPIAEHFNFQPAVDIDHIDFEDQSLRVLTVSFSNPLQRNILYTIDVQQVFDCSGNEIQASFSTLEFALPEQANDLDVKVNEVLFNPRPTGVDFLEVVNTSNKYLNLKGWSLATFENDSLGKLYTVTNEDFLLRPGAYLVLTENTDVLAGEYPQTKTENVLEVKALPSLNDDTGSIAVVSEQGVVIDHFAYTKDYHSVFIKDEEGVSLERISFEETTNDPDNWKSASTQSGYATPGFINSNARNETAIAENITISPEIFTPIIGQPDFTEIQYKFDQGGYVANVKVFDANGRLTKQLANNELLGTEGFLRWDGDRDDGSKARVGYYMVWFQVFDATGSVKTFTKKLAVAAKF